MAKKPDKADLSDAALHRIGTVMPQALAEVSVLLDILRSFGIVKAYQRLKHAETMPETCLKSASRSLDLLAYHGDKWLNQPWFESQLDWLRLRHGTVRFLLSHTIDAKNLARCQDLMKRFPSVFSARLFDHHAIFRAVIIDDSRLLLGHYSNQVIKEDGSNARGWETPQLLIEDNKDWSLLIPFREVFAQTWERARPIAVSDGQDTTPMKKRQFHPETTDAQ